MDVGARPGRVPAWRRRTGGSSTNWPDGSTSRRLVGFGGEARDAMVSQRESHPKERLATEMLLAGEPLRGQVELLISIEEVSE